MAPTHASHAPRPHEQSSLAGVELNVAAGEYNAGRNGRCDDFEGELVPSSARLSLVIDISCVRARVAIDFTLALDVAGCVARNLVVGYAGAFDFHSAQRVVDVEQVPPGGVVFEPSCDGKVFPGASEPSAA